MGASLLGGQKHDFATRFIPGNQTLSPASWSASIRCLASTTWSSNWRKHPLPRCGLPWRQLHNGSVRCVGMRAARSRVVLWERGVHPRHSTGLAKACLLMNGDIEVAEGGCPGLAQVCRDSLSSPLASPIGLLHHRHLLPIHHHSLTIRHGCYRSMWPQMGSIGSGRWLGVVGGVVEGIMTQL